jgi:MFS family permease
MPSEVNPQAQPVDWFGGLALGGTIAGLLITVGNLEGSGVASPMVLGPLAMALLAFGLLVLRQRSARFPFIDRLLLANPRYLALCALGFLVMASNIGAFIVAPFLLEEVNGLGAALVGLTLLPQAVMATLISRPVGGLSDRFDTLKLTAIGFGINLGVLVLLAVFAVGWPAWVLAGLFVMFGAGQAFVSAPISVAITRVVPARATGTGLGLYNMMFFIGSAFGAAAATAMLAARETADSALLPFYRGAAAFSEFSDAYLVSLVATSVALVVVWLASRTRVPSDDS